MHLGPHLLSGRFVLAPLSEFTSWPLRLLCQEYGAALACTEMVKARFVLSQDDETRKILKRHPEERLCGAQLCGQDPGELAEAARMLVREFGFAFVDLNAACPSRRIVAEGAGGGLLSRPETLERLVRALVSAVAPAPVTVKLRSGLDARRLTAVAAAQAAEAGGAALLTVHPRTVRQGYAGRADHRVTAAVKAAVRIPVCGSGDLHRAEDAVHLLRESGCDLAAFARAAVGEPWIFARAEALLRPEEQLPAEGPGPAGTPTPAPSRAVPRSDAEVLKVFRRHVEMLIEHLGEGPACLHVRRLGQQYARRLGAGPARERFAAALREARTAAHIWEVIVRTQCPT